MKVVVKDIYANPFRRIAEYPLDEAKIQALVNSINSTGWWENVVARKRQGGGVELAYGHHRVQALLRVFGPEEVVELPVKPLDNDTMMRMMVEENDTEYEHDFGMEAATIKCVLVAAGEGQIILPEVPANTPKKDIRNFPDVGGVPFTTKSVSEYLGKNWLQQKVARCLRALEEMGDEAVETFAGISSSWADEVVHAAKAKVAADAAEKGEEPKPVAVRNEVKRLARKVVQGQVRTKDLRQIKSDATRRQEKGPLHIDKFAVNLAIEVSRLFDRESSSNGVKRTLDDAMLALIEHREDVNDEDVLEEVARQLDVLKTRCEFYADSLRGKTPNRKALPRPNGRNRP